MGCCNTKTKEKRPTPPPPPPKPPTPVEKPPTPPPPPPVEKEPTPKEETPVEEPPQKEPEPDPRELRIRAIHDARNQPFQYSHCTVEGGEVRPCFKEGLVYCIVKNDKWYFYNDTLDYEAHVDYRFGPGSELVPGERTTIAETEDGWMSAHVVVYPLETVDYMAGTYNGYKSGIAAKPLSEEYRLRMCQEANAFVDHEMEAVMALANGETDEEVILKRCVQSKTPFVDVAFPPGVAMLSRPDVDARLIPEMAMMRPSQFLKDGENAQVDAVCGPVVPQSIDEGYLGDCWLMCSAAVMAEDEARVKELFAQGEPEEKAVGAYRVTLSKNGWWRSVIVDDYLPTVGAVPVFARSCDEPREQWVSLYQKAYAKVHGSYASITGGDALQALQDFTGAPSYRFDKEWEEAVTNTPKAEDLAEKLVHYSDAGYIIVLNTPGHESDSYLGSKRAADPEAFKFKYAKAGLRCGYTYCVSRVVKAQAGGSSVVLFKVHNPWNVKEQWSGKWAKDSQEWLAYPDIAEECQPEAGPEGAFWICWDDAMNYFDGGGVSFISHSATYTDYRVRGVFEQTFPNVALQVTAREPVTVMLVLSQEDKRGQPVEGPLSMFAPIMLSVARPNGEKYRVDVNTSWDPERPQAEYNFVVSRDVAMQYTFQPSDSPYLVIPRIHRKGVREGYDRQYTIGILSDEALEGKLQVEVREFNETNRVFSNIISFDASSITATSAEHQRRAVGEAPVSTVSDTVCSAAGPSSEPPAPVAKTIDDEEEEAMNSSHHSSPAAAEEGGAAKALSSDEDSHPHGGEEEDDGAEPEQTSIHQADTADVYPEEKAATPVNDDQPAHDEEAAEPEELPRDGEGEAQEEEEHEDEEPAAPASGQYPTEEDDVPAAAAAEEGENEDAAEAAAPPPPAPVEEESSFTRQLKEREAAKKDSDADSSAGGSEKAE